VDVLEEHEDVQRVLELRVSDELLAKLAR